MVQVQYISDLHLEHLKVLPYIKRVANNLCLLGDIGSPRTQIYRDFISECSSQRFKNVFVIYGNHEYHSVKTRLEPKMIETMEQIERYPKNFPENVYFLNNSAVYLDTLTERVYLNKPKMETNLIKFVGSTLWGAFKDPRLNDYKKIFVAPDQKLTPEISTSLFAQNKEYILNELRSEPHIKTVVMTHHGTNIVCNGNKFGEQESSYVTHIQEFLELPNLIACMNGHTHTSIKESVTGVYGNKIQFLANCYGYISEDQKVVRYNPYAYTTL